MQERRTVEAHEQARLSHVLAGEARQKRGIEFGGDRLLPVEDPRPGARFHRQHEVEIRKLVHLARDERTARRQPDYALDPGDSLNRALEKGAMAGRHVVVGANHDQSSAVRSAR